MNRFSLTVFTPTYNRARTLPALYESLCSQERGEFEWIVVDDGSTDGTRELAEKWIAENKIDMRYFYQENSGKMSAHNFAVDVACSELFMCLDSDDSLSPQAVSKILDFWKNTTGGKGENMLCGVVSYKDFSPAGRKADILKTLLRAKSLFEGKLVHLKQIKKAGLFGEMAIIVKTDVLRKHKFPVFEGEKFVTDAYLWEKLDSEYVFALMPYVTQNCAYSPDGYSFNYRQLLFSNPLGYRAYHNQRVKLGSGGRLKSAICYDAVSARMGFRGFLTGAASPLLYIAVLPLGLGKYLLDSFHLKTFRNLAK
ncbi:MAG: glycosyltransferase family 2 protein [Bacteroidales bacterium]|nr:glycosyltransferase family 2 protein [Bacteroidales bacterium]